MQTEEMVNAFKPVMALVAEGNLLAKTIARHYIKTISSLTGRPEAEISKEIDELFLVVKADTIKKIEDSKN